MSNDFKAVVMQHKQQMKEMKLTLENISKPRDLAAQAFTAAEAAVVEAQKHLQVVYGQHQENGKNMQQCSAPHGSAERNGAHNKWEKSGRDVVSAKKAIVDARNAVTDARYKFDKANCEASHCCDMVRAGTSESDFYAKLLKMERERPETVQAIQTIGKLCALFMQARRPGGYVLTVKDFLEQLEKDIPTIDTETILAEYMN